MRHRQARHVAGVLVTVVLAATLVMGCSDDDTDDLASSGDTTTSTTEAAPDEGDAPVDDDPVEPGPTGPEPEPEPGPGPEVPLVDVVDGSVAGFQLGEQAEPVIDRLTELLGPPDFDTGWHPSECPPAASARNLSWPGFFVYFGYLDEPVLDGARVDRVELDLDAVPPVLLPDGVEWGAPIEEVAAAVDATAIYDEAFDWWEIWAGDADVAVQYLAGPDAVLDQVMLGYVPVCR